MRIRGLFILISLFFVCDSLASGKIDTIYFQNGDRITGEVKSLDNNHLRLSTDDAGTIQVEWNKIDSVKILNSMRIVLQDGEVLSVKHLPILQYNPHGIKDCIAGWGGALRKAVAFR